jgi:hypothetical protein
MTRTDIGLLVLVTGRTTQIIGVQVVVEAVGRQNQVTAMLL